MLTELWASGLLGYLSHSRKLPAARKETWMTGRELTQRRAAENKNVYVKSVGIRLFIIDVLYILVSFVSL